VPSSRENCSTEDRGAWLTPTLTIFVARDDILGNFGIGVDGSCGAGDDDTCAS